MALRAADDLLVPAVRDTLANLTLTDADAAVVRLVRQYAVEIDAAEDRADALASLGPKLLSGLEALGASPRAREKLKGGGGSAGTGGGKLAQLRSARAAG